MSLNPLQTANNLGFLLHFIPAQMSRVFKATLVPEGNILSHQRNVCISQENNNFVHYIKMGL